MADSKMKLILEEGGFEMWAEGKSRAVVIVASGSDMTCRVTITLLTVCGDKALDTAHRYFNILADAKRRAEA